MKVKIRKQTFVLLLAFGIIALSLFCACSTSNNEPSDDNRLPGMSHHDGYTMTQMTIVARHQIRSALTEHGSDLAKINSHEWLPWTSDPGDLTNLGCLEEAIMGQYFRIFLHSENLIPNNWIPGPDETLFYCNSQQRTIASAQYFATSMLPVANPQVIHKYEMNTDDPVFWRAITKKSEKWKSQVMSEIEAQGGDAGLNGILQKNADNFQVLENVLDFKNSEYAKEHGIKSFPLDNMEVSFNYGEDPKMTGSLKLGNSASDTLKLQYYEYGNGFDSSFGIPTYWNDWLKIGAIGDAYQKALFGSHTAAIDKANPILKEIKASMDNPVRKFTFLSGHDDTIMSINAALNVKDYTLPDSLNTKSPVGSNLVITKYKNDAGEDFCTVSIVYETAYQLRHFVPLNLEEAPPEFPLEFEGLTKNADGMYNLSDVENRIASAIAEYDMWE